MLVQASLDFPFGSHPSRSAWTCSRVERSSGSPPRADISPAGSPSLALLSLPSSPVAAHASVLCTRGRPGRKATAATLRLYALVRRTMRSLHAGRRLRLAGPGGDPAGLRRRLRSRAPHDALTPRRPAPTARRPRRRPLQGSAAVYALVRRTMRSLHAGRRLRLAGPGGDPAGLRRRLRSRAPHDARACASPDDDPDALSRTGPKWGSQETPLSVPSFLLAEI